MNFKKMIFCFFIFSLSLNIYSSTYSISTISLGYGHLDISAGNGNMYVNTDNNMLLQSITLDVSAGFFGLKHRIKYTETVANISTGKSIDFYMDGGASPILKLKSNGRFDATNGGKLNFTVLKSNGYETTTLSLMKDSLSNRFYLWDSSDRIIKEIGLNMRGYSLAGMHIGWYEFN